MSLADDIDRLGIRPWMSDLDKPSLNAREAPRGRGLFSKLIYKSGQEVSGGLDDARSTKQYAYYVKMKELAHPVRVINMPEDRDEQMWIHKWIEWFACNDNYIHGRSLIHPAHFFDMMIHARRGPAGLFEKIMKLSTHCKISLEDYFIPMFSLFQNFDGNALDLYHNKYGTEAYPTMLHESVLMADDVAKDIQAPSAREVAAANDAQYNKYYNIAREGLNLFDHICDIALTHCCRPAAARAIYLGQEADSPMAQTVYGENTPLTRFLISKTATVSGLLRVDPVWWWHNEEIRRKVDHRYAPKYMDPAGWGWLLRAGVPPVILCEHKLTKAEANAYVTAKVPSWRYKIQNGKEQEEEEIDENLGSRGGSDPDRAISGGDILRFRYAEKIESIEKGLDWSQAHVYGIINRLIDREPMVAEWTLNKLPWLTKEQIIHGPRGREYRFRPISRIDEVRPEDLAGDVNASPEKVFERMGERIKKDIEQANLRGFAFPEWKHPLHPEITYLSNSVMLQNEGKMMHHCCGSYSKQCEQGETFIFHVGPPAPFGSTVEAYYKEEVIGYVPGTTPLEKIKTGKLIIYQHYGQHNSTPDAEDKKIVLEWVNMCKPKRKKQNPPLRWRDVVLCPPMRG